MTKLTKIILFCAGIISGGSGNAQISPSLTQFFVNPYHFNSSYAGSEGRPSLFISYRQQWVGVEGAPITTSVSFHMPLNYGITFGADVYHDTRGILNTNSFMITAGYVIDLSDKEFLRFGLSGGLGFRNIDLNQVKNTLDPALLMTMDNNLYLNGNFGISYQNGYFTSGVALPNLFSPNINNTDIFQNGSLDPLNEVVLNLGYRIYFSADQMAFEPHLLYRYSRVEPQQWEAAGILHIKEVVWVGGSYRWEYGISGIAGLKFNNKLLLGYSYGIGLDNLPGIGKSTHEFNLSLILGQTKRPKIRSKKLYLSFVDTRRVYINHKKVKQRDIARKSTDKQEELSKQNQLNSENNHQNLNNIESRPDTQNIEKPGDKLQVRSETVQKGKSKFELTRGNYIIAREFDSMQLAVDYTNKLNDQGNLGFWVGFGYVSGINQWVVYIYRSDSRLALQNQALEFRKNPELNEAWILTVQ